MACSTSSGSSLSQRGFQSEQLDGVMVGMGGCGCGCGASAAAEVGWLPGLIAERGGRGAPRATEKVAEGGSGSCSLFDAPAPSSVYCTLDCTGDLEGSDSACQSLIDDCSTHVLSASELAAYAVSSIPPTIRGATETELEMIRAAWALLRENIDIVKWAICLRYGKTKADDIMDWLTDHVDGSRWTGVYVLDTSIGGPFFVPPRAVPSVIIVSRGSDLWQGYLDYWTSGDPSTQACMALDFAAGLAHELCHVARYNIADVDAFEFDPGTDVTTCYTSFIIGNTVRWALFQRYPPGMMVNSNCCDRKADASQFGCGNTAAQFKSCTTGSGDSGEAYSGAWDWIADRVLGTALDRIRKFGNLLHMFGDLVGENIAEAISQARECITNLRECLGLPPDVSGGGGSGPNPICEICPWLCSGTDAGLAVVSEEAGVACIDAILAAMTSRDPDNPYFGLSRWYTPESEGLYG